MRGLWSWRRLTLLVQPLFKIEEFFKFLPAWAEGSDVGRSGLFRGWVLGGYLDLGENYCLGIRFGC